MAILSIAAGQATSKSSPQQTGIPKFTVSWGGFPDGNINNDQFKKVVDSAIMVKDEKGNKYMVTRFRINYKFINTYKDSETEQVKSVPDLRVSDFYDTAYLSEVWKESIRDNAKKGDEVIINNIIVRLKNGKKMMVPEWKVKLF